MAKEKINWRHTTTGIGDYIEPEERKYWKERHGAWFKFKNVYFYKNWVPLFRLNDFRAAYNVDCKTIYAWNKSDLNEKKFMSVIKEFREKFNLEGNRLKYSTDPGGW